MTGETTSLESRKPALERYFQQESGAQQVEITELNRLTGGAIQENWRLSVKFDSGSLAGQQDVVLRTNSPTGVAVSHSRAEEFQLLQVAYQAGVTVPRPYFQCDEASVIGKPFAVMAWCPGVAVGQQVVRDGGPGGDKQQLAERLGRELALIHKVEVNSASLPFLKSPQGEPAAAAIAAYRSHLDQLQQARPAIEWGLRWCETQAFKSQTICLVHQDFRTGNYLVDELGLSAILDWEFAAWGDPDSDIGWFCSRYWRFTRPDREAGGIANRESFYRGYEAESGRVLDPHRVHYWEVMASIRWAVIALQQADRFLTGGESSLDLALTGRVLPQVEQEILRLTTNERWTIDS